MLDLVAANARRILVAYDGSKGAERALNAAADLVGYGSTLAVVNVREPGTANGRPIMERAREYLLGRQITAQYLEPIGLPAKEIVEAAQDLESDLVVVGRRRGDLLRTQGSVSAEVVRRASCDVLVVR
jgi:nucleotide-binding universal stress UspA family protein